MKPVDLKEWVKQHPCILLDALALFLLIAAALPVEQVG